MNISKSPTEYQVTIAEIPVQVIRKSIKNLHIGVYPPEGRVRVSVPAQMTDENIRLAIIYRLSWIKKQRAKFTAQPRQSKREMVSGENHYIFGKRYRLEVIERRGKHEVKILNASRVQLFVNPGTSRDNRAQVLAEWYRQQLRDIIPQLLNKWQPIIGENVTDWRIKKMRTKWGSCNITKRRIWLNLELAKKPIDCLEYVVVHELVHLLERYHNDRFKAYMDEYLPQWRQRRELLNREPLEDF